MDDPFALISPTGPTGPTGPIGPTGLRGPTGPFYLSTQWLPPGSINNWTSVKVNPSGQFVVAAPSLGHLYVSTNYGLDWVQQSDDPLAIPHYWTDVTISDDGMDIYATCCDPGLIYYTLDGGTTWAGMNPAGIRLWKGIVLSESSQMILAITMNEYLYRSLDGGNNWTQITSLGTHSWSAVDLSSDGIIAVAMAYNDYIYVSNDSGQTWVQTIN